MSYVRRITLFKIPSESDIKEVLKAYDILKQANKKDGRPYILACDANRVYNGAEERSQGYTVAVQSTFANVADVEFYDKDCEAHKELKKLTTRVHQGLCTLLMESTAKDEFGQVKL